MSVEELQQQIIDIEGEIAAGAPVAEARARQQALMVCQLEVSASRAPAERHASQGGARSLALELSHAVPPVAAYAAEINEAARVTGVPADLIGAVIYKESQANPALVCGREYDASAGVALGLMQVEPNTHPEIAAAHPAVAALDGAAYDVMLGSWRLADLAKEFGAWEVALRAYNSGAWAPVLWDPAAPITTGDPEYVYLVMCWWERLSSGRPLPASMVP